MASSLSDSQKLDFLINSIEEVKLKQSNLELLVTRVTTLEATVSAQQKAISDLQSEVKHLKERDNEREQDLRSNALRLFNFPGSDSETNLSGRVYDKLLKPILAAAKSKGDIANLPQVGNTIVEIFRVGKFAAGANKPPPPIVIKFASSAVRVAILKNKRNNTPPPSDGATKKMFLTEDLTKPTYKKMKELQADDRVDKIWSRNGSLWLVKKGPNMEPLMVKSIYDSNDSILK